MEFCGRSLLGTGFPSAPGYCLIFRAAMLDAFQTQVSAIGTRSLVYPPECEAREKMNRCGLDWFPVILLGHMPILRSYARFGRIPVAPPISTGGNAITGHPRSNMGGAIRRARPKRPLSFSCLDGRGAKAVANNMKLARQPQDVVSGARGIYRWLRLARRTPSGQPLSRRATRRPFFGWRRHRL